MREAAFIKSNREKWSRIESETNKKEISADTLADNYIELTDDLSYARTFYPMSKTLKYLNCLTGRYFTDLYKYRKHEKGRFLKFWKIELPMIMYKYRKQMLYSFLALVIGILIGAFSQSQDSEFANLILGTEYVNTTLENIENGDPMAIYKTMDEAPMYFFISTNNIKVAFYAFILGIFFSIGTYWIIFTNGIMLGTFQYFFFERDLFWTSSASIWLHGTLEISAIIIAGGAGIAIGNSILFPGSYKRIESLQQTASDTVKIVVGLIPVFCVAAFIESFLTRLTDAPIIFNITIISLSAIFIVCYFFYYPYLLNKKINGITAKN